VIQYEILFFTHRKRAKDALVFFHDLPEGSVSQKDVRKPWGGNPLRNKYWLVRNNQRKIFAGLSATLPSQRM